MKKKIMNYFDIYSNYIKQIDELLRNIIHNNIYNDDDIALYNHVLNLDNKSRSKRLRGVLFNIIKDIYGIDKSNNDSYYPAVLEMIHCSSLIIDDIQDKHLLRYGNSSLWKSKGTEIAINISLKLLSLSQKYIKDDFDRYNIALSSMIDAQYFDLKFNSNIDTIEDYTTNVCNKTSALFKLAGELSTSKLSINRSKHIVEICNNLGMAYQILDDIDDIINNINNIPKSNIYWFMIDNSILNDKECIINKSLDYANKLFYAYTPDNCFVELWDSLIELKFKNV